MPLSSAQNSARMKSLRAIGEGGRTLIVNWPALLKQSAASNDLR
jgi:hypothetical protein